MALTMIVPATTVQAGGEGDRTLYLHHTHTGETARITFKRNGQYDQKGLQQLNWFLRDWRNNKPTTMDPHLFDLVWEIYQTVHGTQPINIVSSYRAPETNAMLRATTSGVAENSQHMRGKAMDIFIPGIDLPTLRAAAMRFQVGGVGYYPTSGSPFVHVDTGSVRAWPRMTTAQLKRVFPDGRTLHLPADGKPLSTSGRQFALAEWQKCHTVPCGNGTGLLQSPDTIQLADNGPSQRQVQTIEVAPPVPMERPVDLLPPVVQTASLDTPPALPFGTVPSAPLNDDETSSQSADNQPPPTPVPMQKSQRVQLATNEPKQDTAVMALASLAPAPAKQETGSQLTAYAAQQDSVAALIGTPPPPTINAGNIRTASLGGGKSNSVSNLVDMTWTAVKRAPVNTSAAKAVAALAASRSPADIKTRPVELVAPDLDHVAEVFAQPEKITSITYAEMYEPDEGTLDPATELGPYITRISFRPAGSPAPDSSRFVTGLPLLLAVR
ncbi:MAG TPA: DUF882 domain-containing protein [Devosiaceae bacterium]|jgi:uncharacterized protein YcbK (DUF882 family)